jgi:integrase
MLSLWGCDKLSVVADYGSITSERALDIATMLAKDVAGGLDPQKRKIALREEDKRDPTTRRCAGSRSARVRGGRGAAAHATETLGAMMAWAIRRGLLVDNPATRVKRLQLAGRERYLNEVEASAIWTSIDVLERDGFISDKAANCFRLLAITRTRRSEIVGLRWAEVDLYRSLLLLPPLRHKSGGGSRTKAIPLPGAGVEILSKIERVCAWVFPKEDMSGPMEPPKRAWNKVVKFAGVPDATLHTLRHTLASWAVADGVSLAIVGKLLGHTKPQTTERYAHLRLDAGADVVEAVAKRYAARG